MIKYNLLLYLLFPFIFINFYITKPQQNHHIFTLRYLVKISNNYSIWLHAASIGEIKIAINVAKRLINKGYDRILIP